MSLYHWLHVYADGAWQLPVEEHITALLDSGLADELDGMFVGFVGIDRNINTVESYMRGRIGFTVVARRGEGWEQETMREMQKYADNADGKILYTHTKGAAAALIADEPHDLNAEWRRSMTADTVIRWRECVELLETHDAVGAHIIPEEYGGEYFGGNFWWANSSYLTTLPPIGEETRYHAENWIGTGTDPALFDLRPGWPGLDNFSPDRYRP